MHIEAVYLHHMRPRQDHQNVIRFFLRAHDAIKQFVESTMFYKWLFAARPSFPNIINFNRNRKSNEVQEVKWSEERRGKPTNE